MGMRSLIVIVAVGLLGYLAYRWLRKNHGGNFRNNYGVFAIYVLAGILIVLTLSGKAHWLFGVAGAALPIGRKLVMALKAWRFIQKVSDSGRGEKKAKPSLATIQTRFLSIQMDPESGLMTGRVLQGIFRGYVLDKMPFAHLTRLLRELRIENDTDSIRLLETYLERTWPTDWDTYRSQRNHQENTSAGGSTIDIEEAHNMLGLNPGASVDEIRAAHRRLIQKLHPDRGGSDYLATRLNQAKDLLIKNQRKAS